VKHRFSCLFLIIVLSVTSAAWADDKPAKQPTGIFTSDDGKTIVVGVGTTKPLATLDVSRGEVKIGSTGAACTKELAGTLRSKNSKLQFCDGAGWRNVSLDKAE
jgi:hypothetical protein